MLDLLIAGGGPAGLVTALHARRAGLRAVVVDPRDAPIDKACGEGLMPAAVQALHRLGVDVAGREFRGIRYCDGHGRSAVADFRGGPGLGVRRTALHAALHAAACSAGVEFVTARVSDVAQDADGVSAAGLRARYLVAADGLHSPVRHALGLDVPARIGEQRWGLRAHFACAPWTDRVEVHWADASEAYVTPIGEDCIGVAVLGSDRASLARRLAAFPALAHRLPSTPIDRVRAAGPLRQRVRSVAAGRVLLVGDAAGYVDALTGEGLALAFVCAEALVARVVEDASDAAARYGRDHAALTRRYRLLTQSLLWASRRPAVRRRLVPWSARAPWAFDAAVGALAR